MKYVPIMILVAAQCLGAQVAHADSASKAALYVDVHYADLNLDRTEGAAALYARLRAAARQVCGPLDSRELERRQRFNACVAQALSKAVATVDRPLLSAYYRRELGVRDVTPRQVASR